MRDAERAILHARSNTSRQLHHLLEHGAASCRSQPIARPAAALQPLGRTLGPAHHSSQLLQVTDEYSGPQGWQQRASTGVWPMTWDAHRDDPLPSFKPAWLGTSSATGTTRTSASGGTSSSSTPFVGQATASSNSRTPFAPPPGLRPKLSNHIRGPGAAELPGLPPARSLPIARAATAAQHHSSLLLPKKVQWAGRCRLNRSSSVLQWVLLGTDVRVQLRGNTSTCLLTHAFTTPCAGFI
jgi:hypothetical protein